MDWMFKETMEECRFDGVVSEELDCTDGAVEGSSLLGTAQGGRISFVALLLLLKTGPDSCNFLIKH